MNDAPASELFPQSAAQYGDAHQATLLEQYQRYVESAERVTERRGSANSYLLTVNTVLVSLAGFAEQVPETSFWLPVVPTAGVIVCLAWLGLLGSYRDLNAAKYGVIIELERKLPAAVYTREWSLARRGDGTAYVPMGRSERTVPLAFLAVYAALVVASLVR